jgi:hypothetical protein
MPCTKFLLLLTGLASISAGQVRVMVAVPGKGAQSIVFVAGNSRMSLGDNSAPNIVSGLKKVGDIAAKNAMMFIMEPLSSGSSRRFELPLVPVVSFSY